MLPVFEEIQKVGNISEHDMFNTFNMGVGMIAIVSEQDADKALATLKEAGEDAYVIGQVQEGQQGIEILSDFSKRRFLNKKAGAAQGLWLGAVYGLRRDSF